MLLDRESRFFFIEFYSLIKFGLLYREFFFKSKVGASFFFSIRALTPKKREFFKTENRPFLSKNGTKNNGF